MRAFFLVDDPALVGQALPLLGQKSVQGSDLTAHEHDLPLSGFGVSAKVHGGRGHGATVRGRPKGPKVLTSHLKAPVPPTGTIGHTVL